ncbi:hypothetical protein SAMN02745725_01353 [Pseudobutyrivibrio xylanivorans DSM 14809]|uniref:Uncharacterized protein n=1 Tax=Pseudobutyrivibrio xylanivorans DSM 14809 TaxID=1123012 RepID=A0A1M6F261_PSEXY|nr:hypothetical protein SAMN02745725_01353 [Pseudobutyrivibrio xylanivorans DSM 14809]
MFLERIVLDERRNIRLVAVTSGLERGDFVIELDQFKQRLTSQKNSMTEVRDSL